MINETSKILYDYAMSFVGLPYRWGGDDSISGFDCSGLVVELLIACGMTPNKSDFTAKNLYAVIPGTIIGSNMLEFGSLVFYGHDVESITHVAFSLNEHLVIEAGGGGSTTVSKEAAERANAFIRIRPWNYRKDAVAFKNPKYSWRIPK